jgi:HlyD family secretion protein
VRKVAGILFGIALLALAAYAGWRLLKPGTPATNVSGTIESDEVRVASRYGGRVEKIHAREGDLLKSGQVIMDLEAAELRARRDEAAAVLAEMEAGPRKEEIEAARKTWESLVAELDWARLEANRSRELFAGGTLPQSELDRTTIQERTATKNADAARSRYDLLLAGTRPEQIAQARARLAEIDAQLREMQIVAPGETVLEVLSVKAGDVLAPNREVATLILPEPLWVRVFVPEPWLGHIKYGEQVAVRVDSFPDREFTGTVEQIARAAEFTPRNVQTVEERVKQVFGVKIRLDNRERLLRAGMSADVTFPNVAIP